MPIVLALAIFAGGTLVLAGSAPGEPAAEGAQPQKCFITGKEVSGNFSRETRRSVFNPARIPAYGEGFLFLDFSEMSLFRRFLREKSTASAAADQGLSAAANAPLNVFSESEVASPLVRLFSIQIAVRK
ncbi:MAG: hypothetical protein LBR71_05630 [Synergistaceae bacterium]|nr:hypothetical protein [Synergistaceae bacterium]